MIERRIGMLVVTIKNGDKAPLELTINDLNDVATVQQSILREYQEVQKQDFKFDEERLLDNTPFTTLDDLEEWIDGFDFWDEVDNIEELLEMKDCLDSSDYDSIDEMTERLDGLQSAVNDIHDIVRYL